MREGERSVLDPDPATSGETATGPDPVTSGEAATEPDPDPRRPWREAFFVVLLTHAVFVALAWAGSYYFSGAQGVPEEGFADLWRRWDTEHYIDIAEHGYSSSETHEFGEAFFPLYPLAIRLLSITGLDPVVVGMAISFGASVVALAYLFKLAEADLYPGAGRRAVWLLALFPTAVFLTAAYSEALFLAGSIAAYFYARQQRWHLVGLPAAIAMGTRVAGVFLLLGLAVEFARQRRFDRERVLRAAGAGAIALLPLLAYMAYLWNAHGDPLYFFDAQRGGWQRELTNPIDALRATWNTFGGDYESVWLLAWRVEIMAALAGLFFTGWAVKKREFGYAVYMGGLMLPLLLSSWYLSIPRMLLSMFPIPILLAGVVRDEGRFALALAASAPFAALGVLVFTRGHWFF